MPGQAGSIPATVSTFMPAKISKNKSGGYSVRTPNGVHAKGTTKKKAMAQQRLLNAIDHGYKPTR